MVLISLGVVVLDFIESCVKVIFGRYLYKVERPIGHLKISATFKAAIVPVNAHVVYVIKQGVSRGTHIIGGWCIGLY